jgi:hypothetical protein
MRGLFVLVLVLVLVNQNRIRDEDEYDDEGGSYPRSSRYDAAKARHLKPSGK